MGTAKREERKAEQEVRHADKIVERVGNGM